MPENEHDVHEAPPESWVKSVVGELDRAQQALTDDAALMHQLQQIRTDVLQKPVTKQWSWRGLWNPIPVTVSCLMLVVGIGIGVGIDTGLWDRNVGTELPAHGAPAGDAILIISATEDLDFYQDLDFLLWLNQSHEPLG